MPYFFGVKMSKPAEMMLVQFGRPFRTLDGDSGKYRTMVVCQCKCGGTTCIPLCRLTFNKIKSCGCLFLNKRIKFTDYADEIIRCYIDEKMSCREISKRYNFGIDNIRKFLVSMNVEMRKSFPGDTNPSWKGYKDLGIRYFNHIIKGAEERELEFNITIEYIYNLFQEQKGICKLTKRPIKYNSQTRDSESRTASLDRIDSSKGYVESNIQWVHKDINFMKQDFSDKYYVQCCKEVAENNYLKDEENAKLLADYENFGKKGWNNEG